MNDYIVNVPVSITIWKRPNCQKRQWEIIKQVKPSVLFVFSDGGRNKEEWELINQNRKLIDEGIDWNCVVYKAYENHNNGLYTMIKKMFAFIWERVDRCIFLEDDQIPSESFFEYCSILLERYKNDERIECICGMNNVEKWESCDSDYFFSKQGSIWGLATWKRVAQNFWDFSYYKSEYTMKLLKKATKKNKTIWKRLIAYGKGQYYEGHIAGPEFWLEFDMYFKNTLQIIPKYNMINNIGFGDSSEHSRELRKLPKRIQKLYNMRTYEIDCLSLKHPNSIVNDCNYEKARNKTLYYNEPFIVSFFLKILRGIKYFFTDFKYFISKFKRKEKER